jgi:Cys-tRNA(Pro)/Cys-tRNA(Cys) deacylase
MHPPVTEKTNAMRSLDACGIEYEAFSFPDRIHSATAVAEVLGVPPCQVYKTLVVLRLAGKPLLVMVPADATLDLKRIARSVGEKRVNMASHRKAESITGLRVGGISALALLGPRFEVLIDRGALRQSHVLVSAGKRGLNLRLAVPDLVEATGARLVDATA